MQSIKMALLGSAALAVSAAAAQADDLGALKAQIEALNARVAAMEAAPSIPAGYALLTLSEGDLKQIPGLDESNAEALRALGPKATVLSVMPTADAPAGATVTWSGRVVSSLTYYHTDKSRDVSFSDPDDAIDVFDFSGGRENDEFSEDGKYDLGAGDDHDLDIITNLRLRVTGKTDTAVGEVGVTMELRGNFNGNGSSDAYFNEAWGYWEMTPELTLGGGYSKSIAKPVFGFDAVCQCYQTDYGDAFNSNPGDTTQFRLSYGSGPFSMAIALEDGGRQGSFGNGSDNYNPNWNQLGVAGRIGYSGDMFKAGISGVWKGVDNDSYADVEASANKKLKLGTIEDWPDLEDTWQANAGISFDLGDIAEVSIGGSMGAGPQTATDEGIIDTSMPLQGDWWSVSGALLFNLNDQFNAELGAAYKSRQTENGLLYEDEGGNDWEFDGADYSTWAVAGGLYYSPVDQLTLGVEAQWTTSETSLKGDQLDEDGDANGDIVKLDSQTDTYLVDFTGVWRF